MGKEEGGAPSEFERGTGYVVSTWRNALFILWSGPITSAALDVTERAGKMLDERYPGSQVAVSISTPKVPVPDDAVRRHAARLLRERADAVKLSVTVLEGDGFWISTGRMIMTALVALSGSKTKTVVAKSIDEAAALIQPHVAAKATLAEVARALAAFRG